MYHCLSLSPSPSHQTQSSHNCSHHHQPLSPLPFSPIASIRAFTRSAFLFKSFFLGILDDFPLARCQSSWSLSLTTVTLHGTAWRQEMSNIGTISWILTAAASHLRFFAAWATLCTSAAHWSACAWAKCCFCSMPLASNLLHVLQMCAQSLFLMKSWHHCLVRFFLYIARAFHCTIVIYGAHQAPTR